MGFVTFPGAPFSSSLGLDGEEAVGSNDDVVDIESAFAAFRRDIVKNTISKGYEWNQSLAHGTLAQVAQTIVPDAKNTFQNPATTEPDNDRANPADDGKRYIKPCVWS